MKFSIKDFFSKCDEIRSFLQIWSHLLKKFLMENLIFCAVPGDKQRNVADASPEPQPSSKMENSATIVNN